MYRDRIDATGKEALARAAFARDILESAPTEEQTKQLFATAAELSFRMTLTAPNGTVLRDSHIGEGDLPALDNHNDRPEIEAALASGTGFSLRHSNTLGFDAVYAAVTLKNNGVLRVAVPLADIRHSLQRQLPVLLAMAVGVALFCLFLSALITGKVRNHMDAMAEIVASISRDTGKGHRRLRDVRWREILPLACAVNHMADTIEAYVAETTDQRGQLETILDSMHEGVLVLTPTGAVRSWNRALARLFPDIAQAAGKPVIDGIPIPALQNRVDILLEGKSAAEESMEHDTEFSEEAIHFELPAERFLVAHVSRPPCRNESLGAVVVIYNATELMRLERVRRDFVSNVSHELRTPLTAITGYAETLATSDSLSADHKKFAAIIHKHAVALAGIINDLLALARIENLRETIALAPMNAEPVIGSTLAALQKEMKARDIAVHMNLASAPVLANTNLMAQVFRNLLENACRYSPQGGEIHVSSRREGNHVLFCISDNGPGIPDQALLRIFERFYQVKKERNSGTAGIGLAICKHIIERHNGRIWAESPYGEAATAMLFTLPAAPLDM